MACPLCNVEESRPGDVVWQFPHSVALLGPWQYYTGYCILVSRVHAAELHHLPDDVCAAFLREMVTLGKAIGAAFQPRKMNCELLGNQVPHLHWHLFPRRDDDPDNQKPAWLAIDRTERDEAEKLRLQSSPVPRAEIMTRLRASLQQLHAPTI